MNLRKIEISGFKSFMSGLELEFSGGITAILGPNGCGKSNVVDAIRWVLGEQRTRMLRNTKMENVLFNGTRLRKPLGMAEVYLTLSNEDHGLSVDYEDVTIGRRLYRSGVSEYMINGEVVRLKTIKNILVDTGLGNSAYAIIERDMVDRVLDEKQQEKRNLLEEAAGVMRYRIQREEALRKIKLTEQDLVRLADILQELDKETRSLKYQMAKARRYTRLRDKANEMESVLLKSSLYDMLARRDELEKDKELHESIRLADDNEISLRENRLQELKIEGSEAERALQDLHEKRYGISSALQQREEKIAVHKERIQSNHARIAEDESEIERAREKLAGLSGDIERYGLETADRRGRLENVREELTAREGELRELARRLEVVRGELRAKKQLALNLAEEQAREKGLREHLESSLREREEKRNAIENSISDLAEDEARGVAELTGAEDRLAEAQTRLAARRNEMKSRAEALERLDTEVASCEVALSQAARAHARLREKKQFLEKVKREHTRWSDETLAGYEGLAGVLSEFVHVDKRYRRCFEACLAPVLNGVVATSRDGAVASVRRFIEQDAGRVQILYSGTGGGAGTDVRGDGVVGMAASLASFDPSIKGYMDSYLAGLVVVENAEAALALIADGRAARVATLDGVFFDGPGRIIVAGSDDVESTMLEYDAKLTELGEALRKSQDAESELESLRGSLAGDRKRAQDDIARARRETSELEVRIEELTSQRRDRELKVVRIKEKITANESALAENVETIAQLRARLESSG
ncbi:MAG: AAA family ATPase, partial [Candidatus Latescibacterota bacterium]